MTLRPVSSLKAFTQSGRFFSTGAALRLFKLNPLRGFNNVLDPRFVSLNPFQTTHVSSLTLGLPVEIDRPRDSRSVEHQAHTTAGLKHPESPSPTIDPLTQIHIIEIHRESHQEVPKPTSIRLEAIIHLGAAASLVVTFVTANIETPEMGVLQEEAGTGIGHIDLLSTLVTVAYPLLVVAGLDRLPAVTTAGIPGI
ncbi:MAG: hypothetical protein Q9169_005947 [Polycauliona sp. 2 TL-2023]